MSKGVTTFFSKYIHQYFCMENLISLLNINCHSDLQWNLLFNISTNVMPFQIFRIHRGNYIMSLIYNVWRRPWLVAPHVYQSVGLFSHLNYKRRSGGLISFLLPPGIWQPRAFMSLSLEGNKLSAQIVLLPPLDPLTFCVNSSFLNKKEMRENLN